MAEEEARRVAAAEEAARQQRLRQQRAQEGQLAQSRMEAEAGQDTARLFKAERKMLKAMTKPEKMVHNHLQMVGLDVPFEQAYPDLWENYRAVIAHPMDLGTIKRRLKDHSVYKPCNQPVHPDFIRDVTLVWKNCMQYNPPGHPYHEFSKLKLASFERKVRERCSPTTKKDSATAASVAGCEDTSAAPRSKPKLTLGGRGGDGGGGGDGGEERERQAQEKRRQRALQGKLQLRLRFPPTRGGGDGNGVSNNVAPLIKAVTVARCVAA